VQKEKRGGRGRRSSWDWNSLKAEEREGMEISTQSLEEEYSTHSQIRQVQARASPIEAVDSRGAPRGGAPRASPIEAETWSVGLDEGEESFNPRWGHRMSFYDTGGQRVAQVGAIGQGGGAPRGGAPRGGAPRGGAPRGGAPRDCALDEIEVSLENLESTETRLGAPPLGAPPLGAPPLGAPLESTETSLERRLPSPPLSPEKKPLSRQERRRGSDSSSDGGRGGIDGRTPSATNILNRNLSSAQKLSKSFEMYNSEESSPMALCAVRRKLSSCQHQNALYQS